MEGKKWKEKIEKGNNRKGKGGTRRREEEKRGMGRESRDFIGIKRGACEKEKNKDCKN